MGSDECGANLLSILSSDIGTWLKKLIKTMQNPQPSCSLGRKRIGFIVSQVILVINFLAQCLIPEIGFRVSATLFVQGIPTLRKTLHSNDSKIKCQTTRTLYWITSKLLLVHLSYACLVESIIFNPVSIRQRSL
jgi:hypothetical protein